MAKTIPMIFAVSVFAVFAAASINKNIALESTNSPASLDRVASYVANETGASR